MLSSTKHPSLFTALTGTEARRRMWNPVSRCIENEEIIHIITSAYARCNKSCANPCYTFITYSVLAGRRRESLQVGGRVKWTVWGMVDLLIEKLRLITYRHVPLCLKVVLVSSITLLLYLFFMAWLLLLLFLAGFYDRI